MRGKFRMVELYYFKDWSFLPDGCGELECSSSR